MNLSRPEIVSQALHRVGRDGPHLGALITFSSPDWREPQLQFEYSVDDGDSWRPLTRSTSSRREGWSGVVYGVRTGEKVLVRALLGDLIGPSTSFDVSGHIQPADEKLRYFVPRAPQESIRSSTSRRAPTRRVARDSPAHFTLGASDVYHTSPDCSALRAGQSGVAWRGGTPATVVSETVTDAIFEGKRPCRVCRPSSG